MGTNRESKFRAIPSTKFLYEISEDGRILRNIKSKKQVMMHFDKDGYVCANVRIGNERRIRKVHQLVAECWLGRCPEGYEVDHIDRDRANNHHGNLRYTTHKDNSRKPDTHNMRAANQKRLGHHVYVNDIYFPSFTEAAQYISEQVDVPMNTVRSYLKRRRKYIHGFNIIYSE